MQVGQPSVEGRARSPMRKNIKKQKQVKKSSGVNWTKVMDINTQPCIRALRKFLPLQASRLERVRAPLLPGLLQTQTVGCQRAAPKTVGQQVPAFFQVSSASGRRLLSAGCNNNSVSELAFQSNRKKDFVCFRQGPHPRDNVGKSCANETECQSSSAGGLLTWHSAPSLASNQSEASAGCSKK